MFEVMALHTAGRLRFSTPPEQWIRDMLDAGPRVAEPTTSIASDAGAIPPAALADPLEGLLAATARQLGAAFVTGDAPILDHASRTGSVRVHDARR
jgi:PIN domain nuclease of toxin-antitoxin system